MYGPRRVRFEVWWHSPWGSPLRPPASGSGCAIVAEGATNRTAADKVYLRSAYGWRGVLQNGLDQLTYGVADLLTRADPPVALRAAVTAAARPTPLITAGNVATETLAAQYIQAGSPTTVQIWSVPATDHTHALATHPQEWDRRVTSFLSATLG